MTRCVCETLCPRLKLWGSVDQGHTLRCYWVKATSSGGYWVEVTNCEVTWSWSQVVQVIGSRSQVVGLLGQGHNANNIEIEIRWKCLSRGTHTQHVTLTCLRSKEIARKELWAERQMYQYIHILWSISCMKDTTSCVKCSLQI